MCGCARACAVARCTGTRAQTCITKIALPPPRRIVETLFLNLFHGGRLRPWREAQVRRRRHIVIRPLAYVAESLMSATARA